MEIRVFQVHENFWCVSHPLQLFCLRKGVPGSWTVAPQKYWVRGADDNLEFSAVEEDLKQPKRMDGVMQWKWIYGAYSGPLVGLGCCPSSTEVAYSRYKDLIKPDRSSTQTHFLTLNIFIAWEVHIKVSI